MTQADVLAALIRSAVKCFGEERATRSGFNSAAIKCKVIHFTVHRSRSQIPPAIKIGSTLLLAEESTKFLGLWWDLHLSFKKHTRMLKTAQGGSEPHLSGCSLEVGRRQRHFWCRTGPLYAPSWNTVVLCMLQHRIIYDNWTAFTTLDWDWHKERSVQAQYPACTQRPMKPLWKNVG